MFSWTDWALAGRSARRKWPSFSLDSSLDSRFTGISPGGAEPSSVAFLFLCCSYQCHWLTWRLWLSSVSVCQSAAGLASLRLGHFSSGCPRKRLCLFISTGNSCGLTLPCCSSLPNRTPVCSCIFFQTIPLTFPETQPWSCHCCGHKLPMVCRCRQKQI